MNAYTPPAGAQCNINVPAQYATIQAAINAADSGDTVCVGAGTYNENVIINKSIRLSGGGANQSIINGQITQVVPGYYTLFITASNVKVEGFNIKGVGTQSNYTAVLLPDASISGTIFQYNWVVSGNGELALRTDGYQTNETIQHNIFEGNNSPYIAWTGGGEGINFLNNTFIGTVGQNWALSEHASNSLIKQNAFNTSGGRAVIMASSTSVINENNLSSNPNLKIVSLSVGTLNAENNWWGDTDPSDNFSGDVNYSPFALSPFLEYSLNVAPIVSVVTAPASPVQVNHSITATAAFNDQNASDTHTASWNWGDGSTTAGTVTESNGSGSVSDNHVYTTTGVYTITLTVTDNDGEVGISTFQYIYVYKPTPQGLFSGSRMFQDPVTSGKVMIGIRVKYQGEVPAGDVSMSFKPANLNFIATSISSLVTANGQATLRGSGTLNGTNGYTFLATGIDSHQTGGQTVRFQIKDSSNVVVYDSQPGASDTTDPITSITGRIIVHD